MAQTFSQPFVTTKTKEKKLRTTAANQRNEQRTATPLMMRYHYIVVVTPVWAGARHCRRDARIHLLLCGRPVGRLWWQHVRYCCLRRISTTAAASVVVVCSGCNSNLPTTTNNNANSNNKNNITLKNWNYLLRCTLTNKTWSLRSLVLWP